LTVLLWLGLAWLMACLISEVTSVARLTSPARLLPIIMAKKKPIDDSTSMGHKTRTA
jgi:hypothetical protein